MNEFATLLTVGSSALRRMLDHIEPAAKSEADLLLLEVEAIAERLTEIGRQIAKRD